jgi:hypothetical protein
LPNDEKAKEDYELKLERLRELEDVDENDLQGEEDREALEAELKHLEIIEKDVLQKKDEIIKKEKDWTRRFVQICNFY